TAYYNGHIYTGESFVSAFVEEDGLFTFCGDDKEALKQADRKIDLNGRFVCAGFNDSHMHLLNFGLFLSMARLNEHTDSLKGMLEYVRSFREENSFSDNQWLRGRGWNQDLFADEKRMPNRFDIDRYVSDVPVILTRACGHVCAVNSKALELAGIDENTKSPDGGDIGFADGKPNGLFYDRAIDMITSHIPDPDIETVKKLIESSCHALNSYGITNSQTDDYGVFNVSYKLINQAYEELDKEGKLTVRVNEQTNFTDPAVFCEFIENGRVKGDRYKTGPLKMLGDGSLGGRTAWLSRPYDDDPSTCGFPLINDQTMKEMVSLANYTGIPVAIHAIGDRCLDQVLDAIENALNEFPRNDHRHGIVHCQISRADQLERIIRLKLHVYAQSVFLDYDNHIVYDRAGEKLASTSYSWKTLQDNGVIISNGSDAPVELPDVLKGIECAVTRTSLDGTGPYLPDQAFSVRQAIDSFTINGAIGSFEEDIKGKIKSGYLADFVILDRDPFETDPKEIHTINVLETYIDGKCVYRKGA
ncbi:MAG: amidohydrolase, partial [Erysipelotrichaceae bacterium]|nr:amidohydrolase [Erysipelotrichaceae bacterium]